MKFTKMHGIGNDYVYVNCFEETVEDPAAMAIAVSPRHFAIGSDGLILICPSQVADARMEMYNADGSRGKMCGNGVRCVGKYIYDHGIVPPEKTTVEVETDAGIKILKLTVEQGKAVMAEVDMGSPVLTTKKADHILTAEDFLCFRKGKAEAAAAVESGAAAEPDTSAASGAGAKTIGGATPCKGLRKDQIWETIEVDGRSYEMISISMGNPHAIVFIDDVDGLEIEKIGPMFENHERFAPERTNTEFVEKLDDHTLKMRVWERGSGETFACGTGACAVLTASTLAGLVDGKATVQLLGGDLQICLREEDGHVMMTGPAEEVFTGEWKR